MSSHSVTLGYHDPGDFHTFIRFPKHAIHVADDSATVADPIEFAAFVTRAHEHAHLIQSQVSGYCIGLELARDKLASRVFDLMGESGTLPPDPICGPRERRRVRVVNDRSPLAEARAASFERDEAEKQLRNESLTKQMIDTEASATPELLDVFGEQASTLTTMDLLEGQAALAAMWYVERTVELSPERLDPELVRSNRASYDVRYLPETYGKMVSILVHVFAQFKVDLAWPAGTRRSHLDRPAFVELAIFLADLALHLPPDPALLRWAFGNDVASFQDTYPPFRYLMLCLLLAREAAFGDPTLVEPTNYYGLADVRLADLVNSMHDTVRGPDRREPRLMAQWPNSFLSIAETTASLQARIESDESFHRYPALGAVRSASLELRRKRGSALFTSIDLVAIHATTGLPILVDTPSGLTNVPFFSSKERPSPAALRRRGEDLSADFVAGPDWNRTRTDRPEGSPWPFLQEAADRRLDQEGAKLVLDGGPVMCPLAGGRTDQLGRPTGIGRYLPCGAERSRCAHLESAADLPASGCRMHDRLLANATAQHAG